MGEWTFRERAMVPGAVRGTGPLLAWARFWTQGWRFHGRASRSEFLWPLVPELVLVVLLVGLPIWLGTPWRWDAYGDPFGIVPSPAVHFALLGDPSRGVEFGFGGGVRVTPNPWDTVVIVGLALTALPRWTLLVRRLHDRDHTGLWILLLVFTGPIGWLVLVVMVLREPRSSGARFDPSLADAFRSGLRTPRTKRQV
ncbi:DUF805 domain-containing protein [Curtobacterium sp. VKM Ac-2922]|uniref:DUF805 domain-containing protein n=1 Tax=Curtobacterium sp. VKM Ac-2922 TaxID=2929475 RepID=UPI001FB552E7|nr:DUF805 domain-containing protein [Curtobacterium sp. VKM Ac-2922]MCJ1715904.1 DUF805 domain-containing protein [Curtobacterium sp. VKM Ac-2922]